MIPITELTGATANAQSRILPLTRHDQQWLSSGSGECNEELEFWRETKMRKKKSEFVTEVREIFQRLVFGVPAYVQS